MLTTPNNYATLLDSDRGTDFLLSNNRRKVGLRNICFSIANRNAPFYLEGKMIVAKFRYKLKMKKLGLWGKHRGDRTAQTIRYYKKYPYKINAHRMVERLLKNRIIYKPNKCSICNKETIIHAHHPDYRNYLKFMWVCWKCHNHIHQTNMA